MKGLRRTLAGFVAVGFATAMAVPVAVAEDDDDDGGRSKQVFERISTYEIITNSLENEPGADRTAERVAEIIDATEDGMTLVYADSEGEQIGFLDISDPRDPIGLGVFPIGGEPTAVAVAGQYALAGVNTSPDFVNPSGELAVIDISDPSAPFEVERFDMGGQPDSVAVSPDGRYAAVAIENERDEDLEDPNQTPEEGGLPQLPAGFLNIIDLKGAPADWTVRKVDLTGLADFAPEDPEPEFVDINRRNIAAVTLQENNHVALVDLRRGRVVGDFNAGAVTLKNIDLEDNSLIELVETAEDLVREPDAITWIGNNTLATANEGDLFGGSRGFTLFNKRGRVKFDIGEDFEYLAVRHGHYQEGRSDNKGTEPEGIEFARFGKTNYLFVGAERAGLIAVYRLRGSGKPKFVQILPTGIGPEGLKAIPARGLFAVAAEADDPASNPTRRSGFRSVISIYRLQRGAASYPTIVSANDGSFGRYEEDDEDDDDGGAGLPIPWAALSALAGDRRNADRLFTAHDSFFRQSRIYTMDVGESPAVIVDQTVIRDQAGETVDLDVEGLVQRADGSFWVVSEGVGSVDDVDRPVEEPNVLLKVAKNGRILETVALPESVNKLQRRFGFEGVAVAGKGPNEKVYVAFQREWVNDPDGQVRIGVYTPALGTWGFLYYPLETPPAFSNAWVGLSEIVYLGNETFAVIERDNVIGEEAEIKRLYTFSVAGLTPKAQEVGDFETVTKTLARDILPDLEAPNGTVLDKPEGLTVGKDGEVYLVTDNDGVDDAPGETQFLRLGDAEDVFGQ